MGGCRKPGPPWIQLRRRHDGSCWRRRRVQGSWSNCHSKSDGEETYRKFASKVTATAIAKVESAIWHLRRPTPCSQISQRFLESLSRMTSDALFFAAAIKPIYLSRVSARPSLGHRRFRMAGDLIRASVANSCFMFQLRRVHPIAAHPPTHIDARIGNS